MRVHSNFRYRNVRGWCGTLLGAGLVAMWTLAGPLWAQRPPTRGASTRGINPIGVGNQGMVGVARQSYNRPNLGTSWYMGRSNLGPMNMNTAGPLSVGNTGSFGNSGFLSGPTFDLGTFAPYMGSYVPFAPMNSFDMYGYPVDAGMAGDMSATGMESSPAVRPSIRPRLDTRDQNILSTNRIMQKISQTVVDQIRRAPERPFSAPWYAAHQSVVPVSTESGDAWTVRDWAEVSGFVGLSSLPLAYDYFPDDTGIIFAYRNRDMLGRAVDQRAEAVALAHTAPAESPTEPGMSLGVFALVPPVEQPVQSLVHLVVSPTGSLAGYQYDFPADATTPVRGMLDKETQRVAWQVGDNVVETGLENLTRDVSRALLFRGDGWVQPWIFMRVPESALTSSKLPSPAPNK